jgi:hypothetical protein
MKRTEHMESNPPTAATTVRLAWFALIPILCGSAACRSKKTRHHGRNSVTRPSTVRASERRAVSRRPGLLRILPLGDSITQGNRRLRSYRYALWIKLTDAGIRFDFVGSMKTNFRGNPAWPTHRGGAFDPDHEGHWGWKADQVLAALPRWLNRYTPDLVLLHLGTNDAARGESTESTLRELGRIIEALRSDNPKVIVLLAELIPVDYPVNWRIRELNSGIRALAANTNTTGSPVIPVDHHSGFDPKTDLDRDRIHPNPRGEEKMASRWYRAVRAVLRRETAKEID